MKWYSLFLIISTLMGCQKRAILYDVYCDAINIKDFGAIPNDGIDDSKSIQSAIEFAIHQGKSSLVYCPAGIYDLEKGIVIANKNKANKYYFVTLTLTGPIAAYSSDQKVGNTAVFKMKNTGFGLAIQLARNTVIKNIVFEGVAKLPTLPEEIIAFSADSNQQNSNIVTNINSPSCAIVVDPFHENVTKTNRYIGFDNYYTKEGNGGTSMLLIDGCSFINHYIAMANNPSAYNANGDNIRMTNIHAKNIHTFWSAGQTQSRDNSIENAYILGINTLFSGVQIGQQYGTPPTIENVSIAGFCKQIVDMSTGFSGFTVNKSYFESLWSIGRCNATFVSFNQTQLKFLPPSDLIFAPLLHLNSNTIATFNQCDIAYFSNCTYLIPFMFQAKQIILNGCQVEGGLIFPSGISNAGGENLHNIEYNNVFVRCLGSTISTNYSGKILSNLYYQPFIGGARVRSFYDNKYLALNGDTYLVNFVESSAKIERDKEGFFYFESLNSKKYHNGDNLLSGTFINNYIGGINAPLRPHLGFVSKIDGNRIYLTGMPKDVINLPLEIYTCSFHYYIPPFEGKCSQNSNLITEHNLKVDKKLIGKYLNLKDFPNDSRVLEITDNYIKLNQKAISSSEVIYKGIFEKINE